MVNQNDNMTDRRLLYHIRIRIGWAPMELGASACSECVDLYLGCAMSICSLFGMRSNTPNLSNPQCHCNAMHGMHACMDVSPLIARASSMHAVHATAHLATGGLATPPVASGATSQRAATRVRVGLHSLLSLHSVAAKICGCFLLLWTL